MRIALVTISLRGGGTEKVVSQLANQFSNKYLTDIITLVKHQSFYSLKDSVTVWSPNSKRKWKLFKVLDQTVHVFRALRQIKPDVCMIFGEDISGTLCLFARLAGVKRVFVLTRGTPERSMRGKNVWINPLAFRLAEKVIVQTQQAHDILRSRYTKCNFAVIPNPVAIPQQITPLERRKQRILYVASLGRKKNQAGLIRAFAGCNRRAGWELCIVGEGPDEARLRRLASQLGVGQQVNFLGARKDIPELLQDSQVFAFPSLSEGFPNALAEALAHGCACISYDCPSGPSEMITDSKNGRLIPLDEQVKFQNVLSALISDMAMRQRLATAASKAIAAKFSIRIILEKLDRMLLNK